MAVSGSVVCSSQTTPCGGCLEVVRSGPITMQAGENLYLVQPDNAFVQNMSRAYWARIIVEWNEQIVMNPNPGPVGGMVELLSGSGGGGLGRLPELAAALLLLSVGSIYVSRMRRD
jgi:hypothetical protein